MWNGLIKNMGWGDPGNLTLNYKIQNILTRVERKKILILPGMWSWRKTQTIMAMNRKRERWLQCCLLSHNLGYCFNPFFVKCYVVETFSITSNRNSQLRRKETDRIVTRKVCAIIKSLELENLEDHFPYWTSLLLRASWSKSMCHILKYKPVRRPPVTLRRNEFVPFTGHCTRD